MRKSISLAVLLSVAAWAAAENSWAPDTPEGLSISRDADGTIKDESYATDVVPRMAFVCIGGGEIRAQIDWQRFISSFSTEVGFKVDGGSFTWFKWKVDSSEKLTQSPSADDTRKLVAAIGAGGRLTVEVTPYSEGPVSVDFDLTGLAAALDTLRSRCR